ncbi:TVP38/TMEM64 family protein [Fluviispira multicolorata]|nr:VTT domain-containing protein [Fluviispira multicolorata]
MRKNFYFIAILLIFFALSRVLNSASNQNNEVDILVMESFQSSVATLKSIADQYPILVFLVYGISFYLLTIFYIPFTASAYVLFAGALFGFYKGTLYFSFLLTFAYTSSFLVTRYIFHKFFKSKTNTKIQNIVKGFEKDGWVYLLSIRFSAIIPGVVVNTGMGITNMPTWQFFLITQIGTLPHVIAYVYASSKIEEIKSLNNIVSPNFFLLLIVLALMPIILKMLSEFLIASKQKFKKE